jgi:hypothetical protein
MNERIRQLAKQSLPEFYLTNCPSALEKFAELIVKECIQVGGPEDSYTDEWFKAKVDSVQKIKEHFGVEE